MTRNPSSSTCHLVVSTFAVFCKVRQVASRCALKSQNLRGRGKDLHSKLKTKFQSSPAPHTRPTSPSALTQRTTESRESTTRYPDTPSLSRLCRHAPGETIHRHNPEYHGTDCCSIVEFAAILARPSTISPASHWSSTRQLQSSAILNLWSVRHV